MTDKAASSELDDQGKPVVRVQICSGVAILTMHNPPVNAMSNRLRLELQDAISAAMADTRIQAMVLMGEGRHFCAGADIREFETGRSPPWTAALAAQMDAGTKPIIAAISGAALGGGLELALGCHFRVATKSAKLGLPEVKLGLIPGGGGTQRLPRLVGVAPAARLIACGTFVSADEGRTLGFIDEVVDDKLLFDAAMTRALDLLKSSSPLSRVRNATALTATASALELWELERTRIVGETGGGLAVTLALECIRQAIVIPFEEGMTFELACFHQCLQSDEHRRLVQEFFDSRRSLISTDISSSG